MLGRLFLVAAIAAGLLVYPAAVAWSTTDLAYSSPEDMSIPIARWTWALSSGPVDARLQFGAELACPLDDADGDGGADLLVRLDTNDTAELVALAGPDFEDVIWKVPHQARSILSCAPDIDADWVADPVVSIAGEAATTGSGGTQDEEVSRVEKVLDGATGVVLMQRHHVERVTKAGADAAAQGGAVSRETATLLPAAQGAAGYLKTANQGLDLVQLPAGLPVSDLTVFARTAAELQILDATGAVQSTIVIDEPGMLPLAMAPVPVGAGLPNVATLSAQAISPVEQAAAQAPVVRYFNPDGSLAWAAELEAGPGVSMLLPRAPDLDLDGVPELIVERVPADLSAGPTSVFTVLSGIDGTTLFDSGVPVEGLLAAVPFGTLPGDVPSILSAAQSAPDADMTLSALDGAGSVVWSATVPAGAVPINVRLDAYTGDALGFTDITGDDVPDVGVLVGTVDNATLQVVDGVGGAVGWTAAVPGAVSVVPVYPAAALATVHSMAATLPSDLLALGGDLGEEQLVALVDGATGEVAWSLTAEAATGVVELSAASAGDIDGDDVQDILVVLSPAKEAAEEVTGKGQQEATPGTASSVYAVSGDDGDVLWAASTDPSQEPVALSSQEGPAGENVTTEKEGDTPAVSGVAVMFAALLAVAVARRIRRA